MKKILFLALLLISIYSTPVSAQNSKSVDDQIIDYYYYQGQPYHLNLSPTSIFIKFKEPLTKAGFINLTGDYRFLFSFDNFNENESMQIVDLKLPFSTNDRLINLVDMLKSKPGVEYASPVFSIGEGEFRRQIGFLNEIIVQFKENMNESKVSDFIASRGMQKIQKFDITGGLCYLLRVNNSLNAMDVANEIYISGMVKSSEPNFAGGFMPLYMPNDTYIDLQWSVKNTVNNIPGGGGVVGIAGCDMDVDSAWNITSGSDKVLISLVDSGVDTLHEDLAVNLVSGYNFRHGNSDVSDDFGHGTAAAGIIGAIGNNNRGLSGISPICKIMPVKFCNQSNDPAVTDQILSDAVAYSWENGQWISLLEFGSLPISGVSEAITNGVTYGRHGKGTVFVTGTGNNNINTISFPSSHPDVISVGGITPCNQRKYFNSPCGGMSWGSNYGTGIDVVAPSILIYTTDITGSSGITPGNYNDHFWGTSAAMAQVAGVCALMLAVDSTLRWDTVRAIICRTAEKVGNYSYNQPGPLGIGGWNDEMGYGKVNAYRALLEVAKSSVNPIIYVKGIPYGSTIPDSVNHTKFGNVPSGNSRVNTFTIHNLGTPNLNVTNISITGPDAGLFTAGALMPASPISSGDSANFTVTFSPLSIGLKTATVTITNNDPNKSSYSFNISGNGIQGIQSPGASLSFKGNLDCVALPNSLTSTVSNGTEITIEYRFKGSSLQSAVVRLQPNANNYIVAGWNGLHIISTDGSTSGISVGADATDGNWHHIVMTWKKNTVNGFKSYLDGVLVAQRNSANVNLPVMNFGGYLGSYLASSDYLNGTLDEVRIWNRALSQPEIQFNMNCEIPSSSLGLRANYHFNQGIGGSPNPGMTTLTDASGNGYYGSLLNFDLSGQLSNWTASGGVISGNSCPNQADALKFDGINDYVTLPNSLTSVATGNTAITIEYWFKGTSLKSGVRLQSSSNSQNFIIAGYNGTHDLSIEPLSLDAGAEAEDGNWHHIAMTWEKNSVNGFKSYLDGSLVAQRNSANVNLPDINTGGCLGSYSGNSEFMNGSLDEVRIWNRALSRTEIESNMNCEIPANSSGLLANYHFNHGISASVNTGITTLTDASGNGFSGTLNNFTLSGATSNWIEPGGVTSHISCGTSIVNIKVIPQGFYNPLTGRLNMRDTVRAFLHSNVSPFHVVDSAASVIDSVSFTGTFSFTKAGAGSYYIRIDLKNTIKTWSKTGGFTFFPGSEMSYDFTNHPSQAFGNNVELVNSSPVKFGIYSGDINFDDVIDLIDVRSVYSDANVFATGYNVTDLTGDNIVDLYDLTYCFNNSRSFVVAVVP